jgi:hypothetical protein
MGHDEYRVTDRRAAAPAVGQIEKAPPDHHRADVPPRRFPTVMTFRSLVACFCSGLAIRLVDELAVAVHAISAAAPARSPSAFGRYE